MRKILSLAATLTLAAGSIAGGLAYAGHGEAYYDYAKVIRVDPITELVQVPVDRRRCWDEEVVHQEVYRSPPSPGGLLVGGIVGGVVGHEVGDGRNQGLATAAGALVGAAVGQELSRRPLPGPRHTTVEERCRMVRDYREEEHVRGYRVTYLYHGETFVTRLPYDPGARIRINVNVRPAEHDF